MDTADADIVSARVRARALGRTGLQVFPVGLGAMQLSMAGRPDEETAMAVIQAACEAGIGLIDTANVYCTSDDEIGHNERLVHKALAAAGMVDRVIVATKGGVDRPRRRVNGQPDFLRQSCIASLRALGRDTITLYQLHAPDPDVPLAESLGALVRLQEEGKIAHIGVCNVDAVELQAAMQVARIETVQNVCHPARPQGYHDAVFALCKEHGMSFLPHTVVGGKAFAATMASHPLFVKLARQHDVSPYAIVIAWHLAHGERVIPIPGASRVASVRSSVTAARVRLTPGDMEAIAAIA